MTAEERFPGPLFLSHIHNRHLHLHTNRCAFPAVAFLYQAGITAFPHRHMHKSWTYIIFMKPIPISQHWSTQTPACVQRVDIESWQRFFFPASVRNKFKSLFVWVCVLRNVICERKTFLHHWRCSTLFCFVMPLGMFMVLWVVWKQHRTGGWWNSDLNPLCKLMLNENVRA